MAHAAARIAFYGGMANNCYLVASHMHALGMDVVHIRDRLDQYAISQPIWEDQPLMLGHDELVATSNWPVERWDELAAQTGWQAPQWLVDPVGHHERVEPDHKLVEDDAELKAYIPAPADHSREILAIMRSCDLVFVSNVYAIILAMLSGRPYVICPAGGEFMAASGLFHGEGNVGITLELQRRLMIRGFKGAQAVLTNTSFWQHRSLTDGWRKLIQIFGRCKFRRVSLPFATTEQLRQTEKKKLLLQMTDRLGLAPITTEFCIFVPSRIDYKWKGQDRIAEALAHHPDRHRFTLVIAGWGADYEHFRQAVEPHANIRVLNCVLSKPLLRDMYRANDLVIDQFTLGHIGSAAREAAAVGTPVMAWIDGFRWLPKRRPELPVLNARSVGDIAGWFSRVAAGDVDLAQKGRYAQDWVRQYSSPELMHAALIHELNRATSAH